MLTKNNRDIFDTTILKKVADFLDLYLYETLLLSSIKSNTTSFTAGRIWIPLGNVEQIRITVLKPKNREITFGINKSTLYTSFLSTYDVTKYNISSKTFIKLLDNFFHDVGLLTNVNTTVSKYKSNYYFFNTSNKLFYTQNKTN